MKCLIRHFMIRHFMIMNSVRYTYGPVFLQIFDHESNDQTLGYFLKNIIFPSADLAGFPADLAGFPAVFAGQQFLGQSNMLNISFKSRVFSSETLLDGESIMASHSYENMDTDQLLAELARLEDPGWFWISRYLHFFTIYPEASETIPQCNSSLSGLEGPHSLWETSCNPSACFSGWWLEWRRYCSCNSGAVLWVCILRV